MMKTRPLTNVTKHTGLVTFLFDWLISFNAKADTEAYRKTLSVVEPVLCIPHTAQAQLLFQFARNDQYVTETQATEYSSAAGDPKEVRWYDTIHQLDEVTQADRLDWLTEQLSLTDSP